MTFIEKIVVEGFKSYGKERLEIPLGSGFVAVVGPNGAGKSNIGDAISFALGITTTKNLRAKNLSYLIFSRNGDSADHAYVEIHFRNEGSFPLDTDYVVISRRVLKDGRSVFKINDTTVRERDLKNILAKASIYEDGYNVVMQGNIVQFMKMSPFERRRVIEDVAGISEYEEKKKKALTDLGEIEHKISELKLLIEEISIQLERLKEDMEKSKKYKEILSRKRDVEIRIVLKKAWNAKRDFLSFSEKVKSLRENISEIAVLIREKEEVLSDKKGRRDKINEDLLPFIQKEGKITADLEYIKKNISEKYKEIGILTERIKELKEKKRTLESELLALSQKKEEFEERLKSIREEIEKILREAEEREREIEALTKELEVSFEEAKKVEEKEKALMEIITRKRKTLKELEDKLSGIKAKREKVQWDIDNYEKEIQKEKEKLGRISLDRERYIKLLDKESKEMSAFRKRVEFLEHELSRVRSEIEDTLRKKAVIEAKMVNAKERQITFDGIEGVYGYVGDLIELKDESYITAIEVAGGGRLKYIVVEDEEVARKCIEFLKINKLGRASFIPLNKIRSVPLPPYPRQKGYVDFAVNLVEYDHRFEQAVRFVFGDTLVVESFDSAQLIGIGNYRMVTLGGELFEKTGVITGGFYEAKGDLGAKVYEDKLVRLEEVENSLRKREADIFGQLKNARDELISKESMLGVTNKKIEEIEAEQRKIHVLLNDFEDRVRKGKDYISVLEEERAKIESEYRKLKEDIAYDEEKLNNLRLKREDITSYYASSGIEEKRRQYNRIKNRLSAKKEEESSLVLEYEKKKSKVESVLKELEDIGSAINDAEKKIIENEDRIEELKAYSSKLEEEMKQARREAYMLYREKEEIEEKIKEIESEIGGLRLDEERLNEELQKLSAEEAKADQKLKDLEQKLRELGYDGNIEEVKEGLGRLEEEFKRLQREIELMGSVNLKAEEDYGEEKKRYDEYQDKYKKLLEEKKAVKDLIEEIEKKKLKAFMEAFNNINRNLKRIYSFLSPGGRAVMELENEYDPFAGGVNLMIKPRGKDVKHLDAMSGGEKTIAALALIFAIQEYKPSPFYYFDEVDAHLDEANARKVGELIRMKSKEAQFIVVTLREGLATFADKLIGVTARGGVSRVFTVNNISEVVFEEAKSA